MSEESQEFDRDLMNTVRERRRMIDEDNICPQCNGTGVMGNKEFNAECDNCHGVGKI